MTTKWVQLFFRGGKMKFLLVFLSACSIAFSSWASVEANNFKGFVQVSKGHKFYVDWIKAKGSQPTVILLNGLTYDTTDWDKFVTALAPYGLGIFRYDPKGMGKTLEADGAVTDVIRIEDQARDLNLLTQKVGLTGKLNLVGLSYGGGLAIAFAKNYSSRINKAILISPYTGPIEKQEIYIQAQIAWTRITFPYNPATDEELYAYFLRNIVYFVNPYSEPTMLRSPLKPEAVFQMTQGIRKYDVKSAAALFPKKSVHLVIAGSDQYIPRPMLENFWTSLCSDARASKMIIDYSEHKIPEAFPQFNAQWVNMIMQETPGINDGLSYEADPFDGKITQH